MNNGAYWLYFGQDLWLADDVAQGLSEEYQFNRSRNVSIIRVGEIDRHWNSACRLGQSLMLPVTLLILA